MRRRDWSASPLGPPSTWPQSLRSVVGLLLGSKFPMFVAWGPDLGFLYNDPYAEILGAKHPAALGRRFHDIWSEIWPDISPLIDAAMKGEATYRDNLPLLMNRHGFEEQTWFTFSYSPVRDESGRVAGMFCACTETTAQVLAHRRRAFLFELREGLAFLATEPRLRALTLCALVWNVSWFALGAVMVLYAARDLGLSGAEIGLVFAADGVGMVLGALVAPRIERRFGLGRAIVIGPSLCALGTPLILLASAGFLLSGFVLPLLLAGRFLYGFGPMIFGIGATSLRQTLTPAALLGRVNAGVRWLTNGFRPFGAMLGGLAGEAFGLQTAVALAGLGFVLCLVPLLLSPVPKLVRLQA